MSRVDVLFPRRSALFLAKNPHQLPHESRLTPAQRVAAGPSNRLSVMGRPTRTRSIITDDERYKLHVMAIPKRRQSELEYKQPSLIKIPFGVSKDGYVDKVADKVLNRQFMADRSATTGRVNARQITSKNQLIRQSLDVERVPQTLSFANAPTVVRGQATAREQANIFNSQFASPITTGGRG